MRLRKTKVDLLVIENSSLRMLFTSRARVYRYKVFTLTFRNKLNNSKESSFGIVYEATEREKKLFLPLSTKTRIWKDMALTT